MKTILRLIGGMLVGAAFGLIVVIPIIAIIDGESIWTVAKTIFGKFSLQDVLEIAWMLVAVLIAFILNVVLHEGGHLVAGLLTGYRFVSFRFLNWTIIRRNGRLQWGNYELAGTGGQCLMAPPDRPVDQIDTRWYNAGGVLANLLIVVISALLLWAFDLPAWLDELLVIMIILGLFIGVGNGIPMKMGGVANDGLNLLQLEKDIPTKQCFCNILEVNARSQEGELYADMPERIFALPQPIDWANSMHVGTVLGAITRMLAVHQWEEAYDKLSEAIDAKDRILKLFYNELAIEMVFICLVTGRTDEAQKLYTADLRKYVNTFSRTQSGKQRIAFTAKLLLDNNPEEAQKLLCNLKERQNQYLLQGETLMDVEIMEWLWNKHSCPDNPSFTTIQ